VRNVMNPHTNNPGPDDVNPVQADDAEVVQSHEYGEEFHCPPMPVNIDGIVTVRQAPSIAAGARTITLNDAITPYLAGPSDPRRSGITLVSSQTFWYGPRRDIAGSGFGAQVPANVPLVLANCDEVWVCGVSGNTFPRPSPRSTNSGPADGRRTPPR
jgi:hypothetical protein